MLVRSFIVVILALPGAFFAALFGFMAAEFSGDASPSASSFFAWHIWGVFGGACLGALPGILAGVLLNVRWVIPFIGGAIGAIPGLIEAMGIHILGGVNSGGYLSGALVVLGFGLGIVVWMSVLQNEREQLESIVAKSTGVESNTN